MFMHKFSLTFLFLSCLIFFSCTLKDDSKTPDYSKNIVFGDKQRGDATWTFMVYMAADNSLDPFALQDLNEMELVGLTDKQGNAIEGVQVIVLCDRAAYNGDTWYGTRLYRVKSDGNKQVLASERLAADLSADISTEDPRYADFKLTATGDNEELNMGAPNTLSAFITWCQIHYSADYYGLILWDHGAGWIPRSGLSVASSPSGVQPAICEDDTSGFDLLTLKEIKSAITKAIQKGPHLALVGMDACYMGIIENAYELTGVADYLAASELEEPGEGWNYTTFLSKVIRLEENTPKMVGHSIVDAYKESTANLTGLPALTMALVNLNEMPSFMTSFKQFSQVLKTGNMDSILAARGNAQEIFSSTRRPNHSVDLIGFANGLAPDVPEASQLLGIMTNSDPEFLYFKGKDTNTLHGLAIYFPYKQQWDNLAFTQYVLGAKNIYTSFPADSDWDDFLNAFYQNQTLYRITIVPDSEMDPLPAVSLYSSNLRAICDSIYGKENDSVLLEAPLAKNCTYYLNVKNNYSRISKCYITLSTPGTGETSSYSYQPVYLPVAYYNEASSPATSPGLNINGTQECLLPAGQGTWFSITLN